MNYPDEITDVDRRMDFVLLFDVTDGNPNGDPDAGNLPRVDPETMQGLVTDVCLKRKVRNYVEATTEDDPGMEIYVKHHGVLNEQHERAYAEEGKEPTKTPDEETQQTVKSRMCQMFYDVRSFGAVMTTGVNCGQVRGPLQLTFARSIDPVVPVDVSITRVAVTRGEDKVTQSASGEEEASGKVTEMGRKSIVPYGVYRAHGFFNPNLADDTGLDSEDIALFWDALQMMWELDRSASRGMMSCRGLYVFSHSSALGNSPAHKLFDRINIELNKGDDPARSFSDYDVTVDTEDLPSNVTFYDVL